MSSFPVVDFGVLSKLLKESRDERRALTQYISDSVACHCMYNETAPIGDATSKIH